MMKDVYQKSLEMHRQYKGKLTVESKIKLESSEDLSLAYTPGVAEVCREIARNPDSIYDYTIKNNTVAVVSDGSAVLGLGNIGAEASLPVMEGKAILFKEFAGIDAFPLCFREQNTFEIINAVRNIAPVFGAINLEDISAPRCFDVEHGLQDIGIPVFHDDQHGTAVVLLAGLTNAARVLGKRLEELRVVVCGAGAAGIAVARLLLCLGIDKKICTSVKEIILVDSKGIISQSRSDLNPYKRDMALVTNMKQRRGTLKDAMKDADVFIGVSVGDIVTKEMVKSMSDDPIIFAMANPVPEIMPEDAYDAGAVIVGTGRSDFPNQVNNVLAFPGIFRGALDVRARHINNQMKLAAAYAIASTIKPSKEAIIPSALNRDVVKNVSKAVRKAAKETGEARL